MKLWQRLDPRRHLGAAIGWAVFVVVTLFAIGAGAFAAAEAEHRVRADSERLLAQFATGIAHALAVNLETRRQVVRAMAEQIAASRDLESPALRRHLDTVQRHFPEFDWLGIANGQGRIVAATSDLRLGQDVSARPWFRQTVEPPTAPKSLHAPLAPAPTGLPAGELSAGAIEVAAPIQDETGRTTGALVAAISWAWIDRMKAELLSALDKQRRLGLELLVTSSDGAVLSGPSPWRGHPLSADADLSEGGVFLVGRAAGEEPKAGRPGWIVIVRQQAQAALARTDDVGHTVFLSVLVGGLLSAAVAVWFVRMLIRRLTRLAAQAQAMQRDGSGQLTVPAGRDEVSHIGAVLVEVVDQLRHEKHALERLNTELDQRVAERTTRIERLSDDARHAAVTRERLRLARDLHDTLAHSMMALLTQIRLVRKLRARFSNEQLEEELERAEAVATSGLTEARAAINQMRHNGVREVGLGPALSELLARFRERTGLAAELRVEASAGALADERTETAFRIVEEALRNVERHARARAVTLNLDSIVLPLGKEVAGEHTQRLRVEVADDGVGFDTAERPPGHYGVRGMQEQAALIGARLELISRPGHGTRLVFEFDA